MEEFKITGGPFDLDIYFAECDEQLTFSVEGVGDISVVLETKYLTNDAVWCISGEAQVGGALKRFNALYYARHKDGTCRFEDPTTVPSR